MKKLMIAGVAALTAAVSFGIESANIVGYAQAALEEGFVARGVSFLPVNGGKYNLQDIKVVGYTGENADTVNIQILDNMGYPKATYYWADIPNDGIYGWLDAAEEVPKNVEVAAGDGLWVNSEDATLSLQAAGTVAATDVQVELAADGFKMVSNPMPVAINLQDIVVGGYTGANADTVNIQILDNMGYPKATYYWADLPDDGIYGWLDAAEEVPKNVEVAIGDALWVYCAEAGFSLKFESPLK